MTDAASKRWVMWEARATEGQTQGLLDWVLAQAGEGVQIYVSEDRVVAIRQVNSAGASTDLSASAWAPPAELLARPAYQWEFERIR